MTRLPGASEDQRLFVAVTATLAGVLSVAISTQAVVLLGINAASLRGAEAQPIVDLLLRVGVNLVAVAIATALAAWTHAIDRTGAARIVVLLGSAASAAAVRAGLQITFGFYPDPSYAAADAVLATLLMMVAFGFALLSVGSQRRARESERQRAAQAAQAQEALASLQTEELRVRREIADALHGNVQGRVVMMQADLADLARLLEPEERARLDRIHGELDDLRENELRAFSATLYPEGIDRGLVPALRALTDRIPASIAVSFGVTPAGSLPDLGIAGRLALVRVAEEAVSNALRHGSATGIHVMLTESPGAVELRVTNEGTGIDPDATLSGLARLGERMRELGGSLELRETGTGAELQASLPRR